MTDERDSRGANAETLRVIVALARVGGRRLRNQLMALARRRKAKDTGRTGTARKRTGGTFFFGVFSIFFLVYFGLISLRLVASLASVAERHAHPDEVVVSHHTYAWIQWAEGKRVRGADFGEDLTSAMEYEVRARGLSERAARKAQVQQLLERFEQGGPQAFRESEFAEDEVFPILHQLRPEVLPYLGLVATSFGVSITLLGLGGFGPHVERAGWDLEWMFTFPVRTRTLFLARALQTALTNHMGWMFVFPFFAALFWSAGHPWLATPLAALVTIYLGTFAGSLRIVAETTLQRFLSVRGIQTVQGALGLVGMLGIMPLGLSASPNLREGLATLVGAPSASFVHGPFSAPVWLVAHGASWGLAALEMVGYASAALFACVSFATWMVRDGLVSAIAEKGTRRARTAPATTESSARGWLPALARKELLFLLRDRRVLMQTLIVPFVLVGANVLLAPDMVDYMTSTPKQAAAAAFFVGSMAFLGGAFQILAIEGPALWLLFTVPRSIERSLAEKTLVWTLIGLVTTLSVGVAAIIHNPRLFPSVLPDLFWALIGVVIQSYTVAAIGAFGTNPFEVEANRRVRPAMLYLAMLLLGTFAYALYTESLWTKGTQTILSVLVAFALWQKLRDHGPYLLDPTEAPPPRISVADGLIAALAFFVLQALIGLAALAFDASPGVALVIGFVGAGLFVVAGATAAYLGAGMRDLLAQLRLRKTERSRAIGVALGATVGVACAAFGYVYAAFLVKRFPALEELRDDASRMAGENESSTLVLAGLAVFAAPLFEEFIFRGLLYQGLRRHLGVQASVYASAAVFAMVHPPFAVIPVFVMAVGAAFLLEHTRSLLAPIAVHMTYNALVVASSAL